MKAYHFIAIAATTFVSVSAMAQHSKVTTGWSYLQSRDYDKARDALNQAVQNDDTKGEAKTWEYRGEAYKGLYVTTQADLLKKSAKKDTSSPEVHAYNRYMATNTDLKEASISFRKAIELDTKKNFPEAKENLANITLFLYNTANIAYNHGLYADCVDKFEDFETSYNALGDQKSIIDKAFSSTNPPMDKRDIKLLEAGAELQLKERDKAKALLQELADSKYVNPVVYLNLAKMDEHDKDTVKALAALDEGLAALPDKDKGQVLIEKLNIYMGQGKGKEAIDVAQSAIKGDPKNVSLYLALANLYVKQNNYDKATEVFKQAESASGGQQTFETASGIGLIKYNEGAELYQKSSEAKASADQDKYLAQAKTICKEALPDLNKAVELATASSSLSAQNRSTLRECYDALSKIYYLLEDPANGKKYKDLYQGK